MRLAPRAVLLASALSIAVPAAADPTPAVDDAPQPSTDAPDPHAKVRQEVLGRLGEQHPKTHLKDLKQYADGTTCGLVMQFDQWGSYRSARTFIHGFEEPGRVAFIDHDPGRWTAVWCSDRPDKLAAHWEVRFEPANSLCFLARGKHVACELAAEYRKKWIAQRLQDIEPPLQLWARLCSEAAPDKPAFDHRCLRARDLRAQKEQLVASGKEPYPPASYAKARPRGGP